MIGWTSFTTGSYFHNLISLKSIYGSELISTDQEGHFTSKLGTGPVLHRRGAQTLNIWFKSK